MAYNANGKINTSHPLMDEMVYHCKRILRGIVIKNDVLANKSETKNSLQNAEMYYITQEDGYIPFSVFPFDEEYLRAYGYDNPFYIRRYIEDRWTIPEEDRSSLTEFCNQYFIDNFEEENNYYRTLMGLPPFNTGEEYFIYLTKADIPGKYLKYVNLEIPLHLQPTNTINVLYATGNMDKIISRYPGSNYDYINYLGSRSINLYKARKAAKWDILYMPNVYYMVEDKFTEFYKINRDIYVNQTYQEVHADTSDYYDQLMILLVLSETFSNMITDTPEWYIKRDIFDIRSVKYFLESFGVEFYKEIPLKYQIRIVKNINKIIKFKSCTKNIYDIIELFTTDVVNIYKYWLYKRRLMDENGHYIKSNDIHDKYDMQFITSDIDESFDDYIKNQIYTHIYDDITYSDKYWDGEDTHQFMKDATLDRDYTIEGTKYMSIDYKFSMTEYQFQVEYFLGLVLDSRIDLNDIRIYVPTLDEIVDFSLSNIFIYTIALSDSLYRDRKDRSLDIKIPEIRDGELPNMDHLAYHDFNLVDWRVKNIPEIFAKKTGRVHAFNTKFDRAKMEEFIKTRRHSHYLFGQSYDNVDYDNPGKDTTLSDEQYAQRASQALDDLGINQFEIPRAKYSNVSDLIDTYRNNRKAYETLLNKIKDAEDEDDLSTLNYIFQELYTREFDNEFYTLSDATQAKDLVELLKDRDFILYESYYNILNESNVDARQDIIRGILNDVVETLEYYIKGEGLDYVFSFTPIESFFNIVYYIYLMINFFKSYKVYFLDPYMTMLVDNKMSNDSNVEMKDNILEFKGTYDKEDKVFVSDNIGLEGKSYEKDQHWNGEMVDIYGYHEDDPDEDNDYDGTTAARGEDVTIPDMDGGTADTTKDLPFRELDGGNSYLGKAGIDDLNGGEARESIAEYFDVNGGGAYNEEDDRTDWFGTQGFTDNLDAGSASNIRFISRSLDVNVFSNVITMDVRLSSRNNSISILSDGLYASETMVTNEEFNTVVEYLGEFTDIIKYNEMYMITEMKSIESFDDVVKRINHCIDDYLYNMLSSYDDVKNDKLINRVKNFVDALVDYIHNRYKDANPYEFVDIE